MISKKFNIYYENNFWIGSWCNKNKINVIYCVDYKNYYIWKTFPCNHKYEANIYQELEKHIHD